MNKVSNMGMLVLSGLDPYWVSQVLSCRQEEVEDYMDAHMRAERESEEYYERIARPQVQRDIKLWLDEFPEEWKNERRAEGLKTEIDIALKQFQDACKWWYGVKDKTFSEMPVRQIEAIELHLHRLGAKAKVLTGKKEGISPEKIAHAREYPISNILKVTRGMTKCPFHPDNTASMDCRKNFYHCYGCGANGDVIDLVMKLEGLNFAQAITRLT